MKQRYRTVPTGDESGQIPLIQRQRRLEVGRVDRRRLDRLWHETHAMHVPLILDEPQRAIPRRRRQHALVGFQFRGPQLVVRHPRVTMQHGVSALGRELQHP